MSSLVTNPTAQFINPLFGNPCDRAKIYIGYVNTDGLQPEMQQPVYLMEWTSEATLNKVPIPQPLVTNDAGVIVYNGVPVTPWVDGPYSITIVGYDERLLYQSFYVDDPTYWLRLDLATEPKKTADGKHYDPDDKHGVNMVAGAASILSPEFQGEPTSPTPPTGDSSNRIATTEFVTAEVQKVGDTGPVGTHSWYTGTTPPNYGIVGDGSQLSKTTYKEWYAIIGDSVATANGLVPDSASFYIPDARSRYMRGADNGASRSSHAQMMKYYPDLFKSHSHVIDMATSKISSSTSDRTVWQPMSASHDNTDSVTSEAAGDSETMPMSLVHLPVYWAVPSSATVSAWWEEPAHIAARPAVHHFNEDTGEYYASSPARYSPLEPGVWLTPMHATQQTPPAAKPGHVLAFRDGAWIHDADLFQQREAQKQADKQTRERLNQQLMDRETKRQALNDWLKKMGAPGTLDDLENS